ncbi:MAG: adenylate/guanylate cyclase domain-containing protein [Ignavibacteriaceae bacterium]
MNRKSKIIFKEWLFIIIGWIGILYLFIFISYWGLHHLLKENELTEYLDSGYIHLEIFLTAIIFGALFAIINTLTDTSRMRKRSFGAIITIRSTLYITAFLFAGFIIYLVYNYFNIITEEQWQATFNYFTPIYILSIITYFVVAILFINFILQVNRKFGPGNLLKLILGKYSNPQNEHRIFMFMDLKGSTAIAEKLGHNRYSKLMQHCFHELTDIVINYKASIYQYVGDEVVLCWDMKNGLNNLNCIKSYFAFEKKLKLHKDFYKKNFELLPFFKCGIDCGEVTVTEIGDIKREIAYHGDVLNTAARIEKLCTPQNKKMLISEYLKEILPEELNGFDSELIGEFELKGKQEKIKIYSIEYINS